MQITTEPIHIYGTGNKTTLSVFLTSMEHIQKLIFVLPTYMEHPATPMFVLPTYIDHTQEPSLF